MLDKLTQGRAISLNDGGGTGGDEFRAKVVICSCFVPYFGATRKFAIAGFLATLFVAGMTVDLFAEISVYSSNRRLVSPWYQGCAQRVAEGADTGSNPASQGAPGSGSPSQHALRKLQPETWGGSW